MKADRAGHTATLLLNGKILVAGGYSFNINYRLKSAELYDPASGTWTSTGDLNQYRSRHTATLLPNGKVLAAGGYDYYNYFKSAELYDPATGQWTYTGSMNMERADHTATVLPSGKVLVAGYASYYGDKSSAELYDPNRASGLPPATLCPTALVTQLLFCPMAKSWSWEGLGPLQKYLLTPSSTTRPLGSGKTPGTLTSVARLIQPRS